MTKIYVVRFYYADSKDYDEYTYWKREDAEWHKELLADDDMYSKIVITEEQTDLYARA